MDSDVQPSKRKAIGLTMGLYFELILWYVSTHMAKNYGAGVSAMLSGIACILLLYLTICYYTNTLHERVDKIIFDFIEIPSLCLCFGFFIFGIGNIYSGVAYNTDFTFNSEYTSAIMCFLTVFWYFLLYRDCKTYRSFLEKHAASQITFHSILLPEKK